MKTFKQFLIESEQPSAMKSIGKSAAMTVAKEIPSVGGAAYNVGRIGSYIENPLVKGAVDAGKSLVGKAGGAAVAMLADPTPIANDPMEGALGAEYETEKNFHNAEIEKGNAMGPPVPDLNVMAMTREKQDKRLAAAEQQRKQKSEEAAGGFLTKAVSTAGNLMSGLISSTAR